MINTIQSNDDIDYDHDENDEYNLLPTHYSEKETSNLEEMKKIFKQKHPWSISDPFPQSSEPKFYPREYMSTPILNSAVEYKQNWDIDIQKTVISTINGNKSRFKWIIIVLNVLIELCQATITQENAQKKLDREIYFKLSVITSSICLMMSIIEIIHESRIKQVIWVRKGYICCWFYDNSSIEGGFFGSFALYFGLISSIIQLILNVSQKCTKRSVVNFDYLPLLLSVCYLVAGVIRDRGKMSRGIVRCKSHGYVAVEGMLVDGYDGWVFECPEC